STWLLGSLTEKNIDDALAGATPYLRLFASVVSGWLVARVALAALNTADNDPEFSRDLVNTARFYGEHLLPQTTGLLPTIKGGASLLENATF
ncbi:MAG: acyl-CoA dehydrogenase C-terminal domain-containing protein, partial [Acidimicrobiia bacterium]